MPDIAAAALLLVIAFNWIVPRGRAGLTFSEAEISFLFPAPIARRTLIHYRLLCTLGTLGLTALFVTLVSSGWALSGSSAWMRGIGWWVVLATVSLHFTATSFVVTRLLDRGVSSLARGVAGIGVLAVAIGVPLVWTFDRVARADAAGSRGHCGARALRGGGAAKRPVAVAAGGAEARDRAAARRRRAGVRARARPRAARARGALRVGAVLGRLVRGSVDREGRETRDEARGISQRQPADDCREKAPRSVPAARHRPARARVPVEEPARDGPPVQPSIGARGGRDHRGRVPVARERRASRRPDVRRHRRDHRVGDRLAARAAVRAPRPAFRSQERRHPEDLSARRLPDRLRRDARAARRALRDRVARTARGGAVVGGVGDSGARESRRTSRHCRLRAVLLRAPARDPERDRADLSGVGAERVEPRRARPRRARPAARVFRGPDPAARARHAAGIASARRSRSSS